MIEVRGVRAVLTDIEGTTSSLAFVKDVLFPYARNSLPAFIRSHESELTGIASDIATMLGKSHLTAQEMIDVLLQWMDEDRKVTPLKTLQGIVWKTGYESGELQSHVYDDAVSALRKWHADGLKLYIYSSGSIAAQKLLFAHTAYGNLSPLFDGYFDTTTGPKLESRSYEKIAASLHLPAGSVVFLSDHTGETQAAAAAGMQTVLVARERTSPSAEFARSFNDIALRG
ncbi:MAG: enolase [Gammaproteobacteria bacterium]|nr:enolase [Gammaproteobacteria bacterium]